MLVSPLPEVHVYIQTQHILSNDLFSESAVVYFSIVVIQDQVNLGRIHYERNNMLLITIQITTDIWAGFMSMFSCSSGMETENLLCYTVCKIYVFGEK